MNFRKSLVAALPSILITFTCLYFYFKPTQWRLSSRDFYLISQESVCTNKEALLQAKARAFSFISEAAIDQYALPANVKKKIQTIGHGYGKKTEAKVKAKHRNLVSEVEKLTAEIIETVGANRIQLAPTSEKNAESALEKAQQDYEGHIVHLFDLSRFMIIGKDMSALRDTLNALNQQSNFLVVAVQNKFSEGGQLRIANVLLYHIKEGVIIEMQLILATHVMVKAYLHLLHRFARTLKPLLQKKTELTSVKSPLKAKICLLIDEANQAILYEADQAYLRKKKVSARKIKRIATEALKQILHHWKRDYEKNTEKRELSEIDFLIGATEAQLCQWNKKR